MNTILNLYIRKENWKLESPLEKFHYYTKNLEFRKPPGFLEFEKFKSPWKNFILRTEI